MRGRGRTDKGNTVTMDAPITLSTHGDAVADQTPRRRRRRVMAALLGLTVLSLGAGMFSLAVFTDTDASSGTFATGTIDIDSSPAVAFNATGMIPGDAVTAPLTISNDGTASLRYALSVAAPDTLGGALELTVKTVGTGCANWDGSTVLATDTLDGAGFGDAAQGDDTGDRTLAAGANEVLCFRVSLPLAADDTVQNESSSATFTFDAEQTANNP